MAIKTITGVRIAGLATAVPEEKVNAASSGSRFGEEDAQKTARSIGVTERHVAASEVCSSDLCYTAATRLLEELDWSRDSIDTLIFVTQTPDYVLPATSCVLHARLGLGAGCGAFDVNQGCSGYVYGLWLAASLIAGGGSGRILLLVGDTVTKLTSPDDRSVAMLFGDAGTATALERTGDSAQMFYELGTDGSGSEHLIIPAGGFRQRHTQTTAVPIKGVDGNVRNAEQIRMNGGEIFAFTLAKVPRMVESVLQAANWQRDEVDSFVFHQANRFMLQHLMKKMQVSLDRTPMSLDQYGNTSSASIPLTMSHVLSERLRREEMKLLLAGFGVGLSWAGVALRCGPIVAPAVMYVGTEAANSSKR